MKVLIGSIFILSFFSACVSDPSPEDNFNIGDDTSLEDAINDNVPSDPVLGERIDGPANIRDTINGEVLFSLEDHVLVETSAYQENPNWHFIGCIIEVNDEQHESRIIRAGEKIFEGDQLILTALADVEHLPIGTRPNEETHRSLIWGYTYKDNIKPESLAEKELEKILTNSERFTLENFKDYLWNFDFHESVSETPEIGITKRYSILGSLVDDISPITRLNLTFQNDTLVAIVHERPITLEGKTSYEIRRGLKVLIVQNWDEEKSQSYVNKIDSSYIGID